MILDVEQRQVEPDLAVLAFSGRLQLGNDLSLAEHRIRGLVAEGRKHLVFDFSKLVSMDSAGLGMLLVLSSIARDAGGQFRLVAPSQRVVDVLKMARVYGLFSIHADVDAALRSLPSEPPAS